VSGPAIAHVVLALVAAPLLLSVISRVKALVAGRRGPPLLQPYYDSARLLRKGAVYSTTSTWVFRASPVVGLSAVVAALLLVPFGGAQAILAFPGDLFLFASFLALARFVTILAALDTGSSFEGMGASREATFGALTEPALLLALVAFAHEAGAGSLSAFVQPVWSESATTGALGLGALGVVLLAENARIPVDDPATHLELTMVHEVMVLDHSGPDLALIHYASALKLWVFGALFVGVALPQPDGWGGFAVAVAGMAGVAVSVGLVESLIARLRMSAVPHFILGASALSLVALILGLR
jgi:formate hydrogenlyase subunit 4